MAPGLGGLGRTRSTINVTPLVDVLLVLLIIFIMVTPVLTTALESNIPQHSDLPLPKEYAERQLVVHLCDDGRLLLNRETIEIEALPARLQQIFEERGGGGVVFLDADQGVLYGKVAHAMDLCLEGGARTIGVIPDSIGPAIPAGHP